MFNFFRLLVLTLLTGPVAAIAPHIYSDEELAEFPIIVVAKWEKAEFRSHTKESKNDRGEAVVEQWESFTKLKIIRTIKGAEIPAGDHEVKMGFGISWNKDGKGLNTGTSSEIPGDVDDITVPRIWFLRKDRSWDPKDQNEYLSVSNFRCVQEVALEGFFVAAGSEKAGEEVARLLASGHPETVTRSLRFLCGARDPWPIGPGEGEPNWFFDLQKKGASYSSAAVMIRESAGRNQHGDLEPLFIAAYAKLAEEIDLEYLRTFLESKNHDSRIVAACHLIRQEKFSAFEGTSTRGAGTGLVLRLIAEIERKKDLRPVPLLIEQLENGNNWGYIGGDHLIPALKAKKALRELTGCVFPFDVEASKKAWAAARSEDQEMRIAIVAKLAPAVDAPFKAVIVGTPKDSILRLTNVSLIPTTIASQPSYSSQSAPGIGAGGYPGKAPGEKYQLIAPGGSLDFPFEIEKRLFLFPPEQRSIVLSFLDNGGASRSRAWIGVVRASFGDEWKERRLEENVEELWPNGNLKTVGQTVNGERVGDWEFFNEEGDRIREVDYSNGGIADCNPKHPSNKGTGIRKKN